jgi:predicted nucleic acid-binding protein
MTLDQIPAGANLFLDANSLVYHFTSDPKYGAACTRLARRLEQRLLVGFVSTHVMADVIHRVMTIEAITATSWPKAWIAARLRKHHDEIPKLLVFEQVMASIPALGLRVLPITESLLGDVARISKQHELLVGDALIVGVMQTNGLTKLASGDADFDRVPGITRYAPV